MLSFSSLVFHNEAQRETNQGFVCKECIGKGIKNGGSAGLVALGIAGGIALKVIRKGK